MRILFAALAAAVFVFTLTPMGRAHHGWSNYDASQKLQVTGPVQRVNYGNPHATINMAYKSEEWVIVLAPVSRLEARGVTPDKIAVGKILSVTGYPDKSGAKEIRAEFLTIDGADYQLR
ncbi:MAG: DUF6152 family protein [Hyphomicrobiales bacterium]|nr:DUF6152 family protein [Hyphomicrobiales bacterium]